MKIYNYRGITPGLLSLLSLLFVFAQPIDPKIYDRLDWRNIGPANMGGRVTDIEGLPGNPFTVYVGTGTGGLWKTTNMGIDWTPLFEKYETHSVGDFALDPQNPEVIWLGTGESNVRNSVSFGAGVYHSNDGGKTWSFKGLKDTRHVSRVIVHPKDSNTVYVAALGHAYGPNEERGIFVTRDGGKTWQKTLYIDNQHGAADMDIDPVNPNILYAAMWKFERKPWTHTSGSEQGGVYQSTDGGNTWRKLENGLPKLLGRIGIKVAPSNPQVVYVICESQEGTLYRSDDRGESFQRVHSEKNIVSRGFYYSDLRVDPVDENRVYAIAASLFVSIDGGKTFNTIANRVHSDHHSIWIDPKNPNFVWGGNDGGIAYSINRGARWDTVNNIPLAQYYQVNASMESPFYSLCGGLQDNGTWVGPARSKENAIVNEHWQMVSFGDGFYALIHPDNPNLIITESQGGNIVRTDMQSGVQVNISPQPRRNDGGPVGDLRYRFNWNTPIIPSPHDKNTVYIGGNVLFKSTDFGTNWIIISPDLTTDNKDKQKDAGGPVWIENTTAEYHCTIISIAESPLERGVIWVGTDDGNLQVTRNNGATWTNLIKNVPDLGNHSPVSHIEPSRADANRVYASFDRHMLDDSNPYVYKSTDGGKTWKKITQGLPENAYVWVVREDPKNPNLLYCGTEVGLFGSFDAGEHWHRLHFGRLPHAAVHDILVHPLENDLVVATHGRSLWVLDDASPLQQMNAQIVSKTAHLLEPRVAWHYTSRFARYGGGDRPLRASNPPYGAILYYYLKERPERNTTLRLDILDAQGKVVRSLRNLPRDGGINRVVWDLRISARPMSEEGEGAPAPPGGGGGGRFGGGAVGPPALPGIYRARLTVGQESFEQSFAVKIDSSLEPFALQMRAGHQYALETRAMIDSLNGGTRAINNLETQIKNLQQSARDTDKPIPEALGKSLEDHLKRIEATRLKIENPPGSNFWSRGQKLGSRLNAVYGTMASLTGPMPQHIAYFEEVKGEYEAIRQEIKAILNDAGALNDALKSAHLPTLMIVRWE